MNLRLGSATSDAPKAVGNNATARSFDLSVEELRSLSEQYPNLLRPAALEPQR